jgi:hypothetical protein
MAHYESDKPYKIDHWNELVGDVNDILQNPPANTDCEPISPIDEVSDPHRWAVADVEEVRDKLQETCASISFSTELVLWEEDIIDEIADQMGDAWCDCEEDTPDEPPYTEQRVIDTREYSIIPAAVGNLWCCGNVIESAPCYLCPGLHCKETEYEGEWYPNPYNDNATKHAAITASYSPAWQATAEVVRGWHDMKDAAAEIEKYQEYVDSDVAEIDRLIAEHEAADPADKPAIAAQICSAGYWTSNYQEKVNDAIALWNAASAQMEAGLSQSEPLCADNLAAIAEYQVRHPPDVNATIDIFKDAFADEGWLKGFNPYTDKYLCDKARYFSGTRVDGEDFLPVFNIFYVNSNRPTRAYNFYRVDCSPTGTLILSQARAFNYLRRYALTYYKRRYRIRCETAGCGGCDVWKEWNPWDIIYWDQNWRCSGLCGRVWSPLPTPDPGAKGTDSFYIRIRRPIGRKGVDNSGKQAQYRATYDGWYNDHPQYDGRHEAYC